MLGVLYIRIIAGGHSSVSLTPRAFAISSSSRRASLALLPRVRREGDRAEALRRRRLPRLRRRPSVRNPSLQVAVHVCRAESELIVHFVSRSVAVGAFERRFRHLEADTNKLANSGFELLEFSRNNLVGRVDPELQVSRYNEVQ